MSRVRMPQDWPAVRTMLSHFKLIPAADLRWLEEILELAPRSHRQGSHNASGGMSLIPPQRIFHLPMQGRPHSYPWFTGDTLRYAANWIVDETIIALDVGRMRDGEVVFVKTDLLGKFGQLSTQIKTRFVLVTHNSALSPPRSTHYLLKHPMLIRWFAQNPSHPSMFALPVGLANQRWPHGNVEVIKKLRRSKCDTSNRYAIYNRQISRTHPARDAIQAHFERMDGARTGNHRLSFEQYLTEVHCADFVVCPPGSGFDSHCAWEAALLGTIPLVEDSLLRTIYARDLERFRIYPSLLNASRPTGHRFNDASKLVMFDYWWDQIKS